jgi:hypothetical protein
VNYFKSSTNYHFIINEYYFITGGFGGYMYEVRNSNYIFCGMVDKKCIDKNFIIVNGYYNELQLIFNDIMDNYESVI